MIAEEVAERVRRGDPDAVSEVYVILADQLLGYLISIVRDRGAAEDLLETTFIELLRKGHTINGGGASVRVWLFRAAYFNALDYLRKVSRRIEDITDDFSYFESVDTEYGPEELVEQNDRRQVVRTAMQHLSEDQRTVLQLRYLAGLSAAETAATLEKTEGAVRSLQHRAERSLARLLEGTSSDPQIKKNPKRRNN